MGLALLACIAVLLGCTEEAEPTPTLTPTPTPTPSQTEDNNASIDDQILNDPCEIYVFPQTVDGVATYYDVSGEPVSIPHRRGDIASEDIARTFNDFDFNGDGENDQWNFEITNNVISAIEVQVGTENYYNEMSEGYGHYSDVIAAGEVSILNSFAVGDFGGDGVDCIAYYVTDSDGSNHNLEVVKPYFEGDDHRLSVVTTSLGTEVLRKCSINLPICGNGRYAAWGVAISLVHNEKDMFRLTNEFGHPSLAPANGDFELEVKLNLPHEVEGGIIGNGGQIDHIDTISYEDQDALVLRQPIRGNSRHDAYDFSYLFGHFYCALIIEEAGKEPTHSGGVQTVYRTRIVDYWFEPASDSDVASIPTTVSHYQSPPPQTYTVHNISQGENAEYPSQYVEPSFAIDAGETAPSAFDGEIYVGHIFDKTEYDTYVNDESAKPYDEPSSVGTIVVSFAADRASVLWIEEDVQFAYPAQSYKVEEEYGAMTLLGDDGSHIALTETKDVPRYHPAHSSYYENAYSAWIGTFSPVDGVEYAVSMVALTTSQMAHISELRADMPHALPTYGAEAPKRMSDYDGLGDIELVFTVEPAGSSGMNDYYFIYHDEYALKMRQIFGHLYAPYEGEIVFSGSGMIDFIGMEDDE